MKLAQRVGRTAPSATLRITAEAKAMVARGVDVIDFASGEPDFDTPLPVKEAGIAAIRSGFTKYTAAGGIDELKLAVVEKLRRDQGLTYDTSQVLISCGAKHTLYNLAQALYESGDEVIIPSPYWVSFPEQVLLNDATPVLVPTEERHGFRLTGELLARHVTPRTKAVVINTPGNPTGSVYDRRTLEDIAKVALRHDLLIISDEIYEKLLYDGLTHVSIASPHRRGERRVQGLRDDRVEDRLRRGAERPDHRHDDGAEPEHVQPHIHRPEGSGCGAEPGRRVH